MTAHFLACIAEECGELTQALCKALRFGLTDEKLERIKAEYNDLIATVELLESSEDISLIDRDMVDTKKIKVRSYMP